MNSTVSNQTPVDSTVNPRTDTQGQGLSRLRRRARRAAARMEATAAALAAAVDASSGPDGGLQRQIPTGTSVAQDGGEGGSSVVPRAEAALSLPLPPVTTTVAGQAGGAGNPSVVPGAAAVSIGDDAVCWDGDDDVLMGDVGAEQTHGDEFTIWLDTGLPAAAADDDNNNNNNNNNNNSSSSNSSSNSSNDDDDDDNDDDEHGSVAAVAAAGQGELAALGALVVPVDTSPLPCARCFRGAFAGAGPLSEPRCVFATGSSRCGQVSCQKKGNCRPLPGLLAGDLWSFLRVVRAALAFPALAADPGLGLALRARGRALSQAMDAHRRAYGLTGARPDREKEAAYEAVVATTRASLAGATAGRPFLLCLRPDTGQADAVRRVVRGAYQDVVGQAGELLTPGVWGALDEMMAGP